MAWCNLVIMATVVTAHLRACAYEESSMRNAYIKQLGIDLFQGNGELVKFIFKCQ